MAREVGAVSELVRVWEELSSEDCGDVDRVRCRNAPSRSYIDRLFMNCMLEHQGQLLQNSKTSPASSPGTTRR